MNLNLSRPAATTSLLLLSAFLLRGEDAMVTAAATTTAMTTTAVTGPQSARKEIAQRRELLASARQSVQDGEKLYSAGKYDDAALRFQYALDALTTGGESATLYARAQADLAAAKAGQARGLAADGKFAQAAARLQEAISLQPNDPSYTRDLEDLKQQQIVYEEQSRDPEGTVNNPAVTQDFKDRVATVQKLLFQGDAYFRTGQYEKAEDTFSKILILDPYNKAARDEMNHMERYRYRAANLRRIEYKDEAMLKVNQEWSEVISPDIVVAPTVAPPVTNPSNRAEITAKLQSIIIDKIDFDKLDVATVVQFLTQKSKELDPAHVGINFVLNLNTEAPPADTGATNGAPAAATPSGASTGAATTGTASTDNSGGTAPPPAATSPGLIHRAVSLQLENVPLANVLGYILAETNLQYSVDDYAVYLRPQIDEGQTLTVRTFPAPPNFFTNSGGLRVSSSSSSDQPTKVEDISSNVQDELANRGIRFPPGATATFLPGSSKLVVRNTPEQLDLIANLIEQLSKETPEVQIEAKLAELTEDALKSLSFNYYGGFRKTLANVTAGGFQVDTSLRDANYVNSSATTGVQTGGLAPDSINSLIQANTATAAGTTAVVYNSTGLTVQPNTPNIFTIGAVIDGVGFAAVINALNNNTGVDLISAPTVTTQTGLKANIDIVREFPYPTSFEKPKLSNTEVAYSSGKFGPLPSNDFIAPPLELAIPPTPREFVTQDIGVSLEVKPTTYPDQRIDLDITKAEVIDFDGFIDYGSPILTKLAFEFPVSTLTPGTINQPVFNIRSIATRLQLLDGQTAVLGGLLREDTQEIRDKVPVLGDIPLLGRFFQSKVTERTKKNLLIFVTAKLIRSNGKPQYMRTLNAEPEEEKLPEPAPLGPGVVLPPLSEGQPNS
jgi:general secretion pathway protein D